MKARDFISPLVRRKTRSILKDVLPPVVIRTARYVLKGRRRRHRDAGFHPGDDVKQRYVREYGSRFGIDVFVETGTYMGEMINAVKKDFKRIYSIELSHDLHQRAARWFDAYPHVRLIQGDSGAVIPDLAREIQEPCLFWLDAHYSGGPTARGDLDTPIAQELASILSRSFKDVILIDDARHFIGLDDYPTLDTLKTQVEQTRPEYELYSNDDIIFIHA
jgi:hypothetical protein